MSRLERSESARMNMFMFIHIYIYVYEYARIFICQYTYMVSIDGHMHLCDSSSRQFRIVLKPLEHILTMWLYQYLSLFKHRQSKLSIRCSNVIFTSSVSFWCFFYPPSGISAQAPGPGRSTWFSAGSTCSPDSATQSMSKLGQENLKLSNLQALSKCIWSSTKDNQIQSNSQGSSGPWLWGISVLSCLLPLLLFLVKKHFFTRLKNRKRTSRAVEAQTAEDKERFFTKYAYIYIYI